jgi:hypothetical protein
MRDATRIRVKHGGDQPRLLPTSLAALRSDKAYRCSDGELVVILRDPQHHLLGRFASHLLGQDAGFFRSIVPMLWVVEMRA